MNNYRIISDIGSGAYSTVHKAIDVTTGHIVAIKKISSDAMNIKHIINREVTFLHKCINHPNIIQLYKCFSVNTFTYLVFEYMPMDLISYYKSVQESRKRNLNDEEIAYIAFQLCNALKFLHQKGIMHRDIKPQNILIDPETLNVKLIDFGFAKVNDLPINTNYMVTRWYRPLEIVLNLQYDQKVDIFALGALIIQLYLGKQIFRSSSNVDQFYWIVNICGYPQQKWGKAHQMIGKLKLVKEETVPQLKQLLKPVRPLAADLIMKMLKTSPEERISMSEAVEHPFFSRFRVKTMQLVNNHGQMESRQASNMRQESFRNAAYKRNNRALSTEQQHQVTNTLASKQHTNRTETSESKCEVQLSTVTSGQLLKIHNSEHNSNLTSQEYIVTPKKHFIKRVSTQKTEEVQKSRHNNNNAVNLKNDGLKLKQAFNDNKLAKPEERARNRVRSMNTHGINVVSLKKLKVHRQIDNEKSKGKQRQKQSRGRQEYGTNSPQAIRLHPRREKEKPMFMRVKEKINEGRINERGEERAQLVTSNGHNKEVPTKIFSSAQLKVRKMGEYKEYRFDE